MTDFTFKDDDAPAQSAAKPAAPVPTAPTPQVPMPQAPAPHVPSPQVPTPQVPAPQVPASPPTPKPAAQKPAAPQNHRQAAPQADEHTKLVASELVRRDMKSPVNDHASNAQGSMLDAVIDWLAPIGFWMLRASALFGGLAIAYLLWGIFSGGMQGKAGNVGQTVQNVKMAIVIINWSLLGAALSCIILMWQEKFVALVTAILGVLIYFGAAPLLRMAGDSIAIREAASALQRAGLPLLVLGGLKYTYDMMQWVIDLPNRMRNIANVGVAQRAEPRQQREAQNANMFSPCWKLPFCREVIRKQCPAYLARRTCWKFGRGCYCDEEMISRIIRGESLDTIKAPTRMSRQGKPPCGRCYIFLEHQGMKYRALSPLAIPATLGIMYYGWSTYLALTDKLVGSLGFLWSKLAFQTATTATQVANGAKKLPAAASTLSPEQIQNTAQNMFGFMLGFALLIYVSKAIEWAIYKAKL